MRKHKTPAWITISLTLALLPSALHAQQSTPAFEVATIKPAVESRFSNSGFNGQHFTTRNMTLRSIIQFAYGLNFESQIADAPQWIDTARFDIDAKEDEATAAKRAALPREQRDALDCSMIQAMLADRFGLKAHHDTRKLPVLALVAAKGGPKLKPSTESAIPTSKDAKPAGPQTWSGLHNRDGSIEGRGATVAMLVSALGWRPEAAGRMVVDQTGLTGTYDFLLKWAPDDRENTSGEPSVFAALPEQLGLKLESVKAPVDLVVIDHVEMPSAN